MESTSYNIIEDIITIIIVIIIINVIIIIITIINLHNRPDHRLSLGRQEIFYFRVALNLSCF